MKKCLIILIFTMFHYAANCQIKQQLFGVRIATSLANFSNNTLPTRYHSRGISFDLGLTNQILRPDKLGFNVEVGYSRKNVKNNYFGYALNYLTLGFMPNYYFSHSKTYIYAGGYAAILTSYRVINDYPKSGESFKQFDTGLIIGTNQKIIKTQGFQINLDARFNKGFISIRDETWEGKTRNYGYSLGLIFSKK